MSRDSLTVSLRALIAVSPLLGHALEDRSAISSRQDLDLLRRLQDHSTVELSHPDQALLFLVAPLDVLCAEAGPTSCPPRPRCGTMSVPRT
jgi:hypothetical protein